MKFHSIPRMFLIQTRRCTGPLYDVYELCIVSIIVEYLLQIQIDEEFQRKGLGKFMMQVLEMLAFKADMRKIMLTVLKHNDSAVKFFKALLKFEIDETNPAEDVQWNEKYNDIEQIDYEILSKFNKRKLMREATENLSLQPAQPKSACKDACC